LAEYSKNATSTVTAIDVREGRLVMNNRTDEGPGTLDIRVHSGATLSGGDSAGTAGLVPGMIRVEAGGKLAPGDGDRPGILSVVRDFGTLELAADSIYQPTLAGNIAGSLHDQVRVTGSVKLGDPDGNVVLAPMLNYSPALGDLMFLIDNDDADPVFGLFQTSTGDILAQDTFLQLTSTADGQAYRFQIGYTGNVATSAFASPDGNDVVLRSVGAVPEPATWMLGLMAAVILIGRAASRHRALAKRGIGSGPSNEKGGGR
jgi:hypothetical protein